jgi:hypothetical protein
LLNILLLLPFSTLYLYLYLDLDLILLVFTASLLRFEQLSSEVYVCNQP